MTKEPNTTSAFYRKELAFKRLTLFVDFKRMLEQLQRAIEAEEWADGANWDGAFGDTISEAEAAWQSVAELADAVINQPPLSLNDLLLHRVAGSVRNAVAAGQADELLFIHAKAERWCCDAPPGLSSRSVRLANGALLCLDRMYEIAAGRPGGNLPSSV
ncbi:hypothetical protein [Roseovarius sp.]|uniref:hypothetical protein n=1 Tax=Roseovarius sp. TaxID=1486281 RepID=UPI0035145C27